MHTDKEGAHATIEGKPFPPTLLQGLLPETIAILETLRSTLGAAPGTLTKRITKERFQSLYKALHEKICSSPSGCHIGHYKAVAQSDTLADIYTKMMDIPHIAGISPKRWREVVDVMLRKSPGDSRIHRLKIIALQESDYNQSNTLNIGQPIMYHLEDTNALPNMQYVSRPAKLCASAVLNKQLTFEITRYKWTSIAYIENDTTGCYDRITNPLVLLYLRKKGIPINTTLSLAKTWEHTIHRIKTAYGVSEQSYKNTLDYFLFGPGQGSTIGPVLWLICFILICTSLSSNSPSIIIHSVDKAHTSRSKGCAFVDDSGLGCSQNSVTLSQPTDIVNNLNALAQEWERLLYSTGGALNLQKFLVITFFDLE
jgi:hypothetical protein